MRYFAQIIFGILVDNGFLAGLEVKSYEAFSIGAPCAGYVKERAVRAEAMNACAFFIGIPVPANETVRFLNLAPESLSPFPAERHMRE